MTMAHLINDLSDPPGDTAAFGPALARSIEGTRAVNEARRQQWHAGSALPDLEPGDQ